MFQRCVETTLELLCRGIIQKSFLTAIELIKELGNLTQITSQQDKISVILKLACGLQTSVTGDSLHFFWEGLKPHMSHGQNKRRPI